MAVKSSFPARLFELLTLLSCLLAFYYGVPQGTFRGKKPEIPTVSFTERDLVIEYDVATANLSNHVVKRAGNGHNFGSLRILPVGDSITEGWPGGDHNGYRLRLRNLLIADGNSVQFIGARSEGDNNPDNRHEGYGGRRIDQIEGYVVSDNIMVQNPNIILLHAGTNDMNQDPPIQDPAGAPDRLAHLIDLMLCQNPDAVLFVAAILQIPKWTDRVANFNGKIPGIVQDRYKRGYKIRMVNFYDIMTPSDLVDGVHPTDDGYHKMGDIWWSAINNIPTEWVTQPRAPGDGGGVSGPREECRKTNIWWSPAIHGNLIALGARVPGDTGIGKDAEPIWLPDWGSSKNLAQLGFDGFGTPFFVDMNGDGKADQVQVDSKGRLWVFLNDDANGKYTALKNNPVTVSDTFTLAGVSLVDLNHDGRADFVWVDGGTPSNPGAEGQMFVYINQGIDSTGALSFTGLGRNFSPGGITRNTIMWGDVNGDGLKDLLVRRDGGKIDAFLQDYSVAQGGSFSKKCESFVTNTDPHLLLADLDGDGRDDWLSIDDYGGLTGYLNTIGSGPCGITWYPLGDRNGVAGGAGLREFVRIADFDGDGKADYLVIRHDDNHSLDFFKNSGARTNITQMYGVGAGVRLADLTGDGRDDYIAVGPDSSAIAFYNGGETEDGTSWRWPAVNLGEKIAWGSNGAKRHQIHFADVNGDGRADYLVVDDETGAVHGYFNKGQHEGGWQWSDQGSIAAGVPYRGGTPGAGVRFGDLDGDGRDDYLWLDAKGAMTGFLNLGATGDAPQWRPLNNWKPIATGVGGRREDIQMADLNGDGRVDYLWVHPEEGKVDVWWNDGPADDGNWKWIGAGSIALGTGYPGRQIKFGRMGTKGRADYLSIEPSTGAMKCHLNACSDVVRVTPGKGSSSSISTGACLDPPNKPRSDSDPGAPILIFPPPVGGEPIPGPGEGNPAPPNPSTTFSFDPTTTTGPSSTSGNPVKTLTPCDIDTYVGLCANGNYPLYDPVTKSINCDHSPSDADSLLSECQRNIDNHIDSTRNWIEDQRGCCSSSGKAKRAGLGLIAERASSFLGIKRATTAHGYCPVPGQDPHSQPNGGGCFATWTCPDDLFPGVCGNAKSAITVRGKTTALTHHTREDKHDTNHMYFWRGRYRGSKAGKPQQINGVTQGGWGLKDCQAEEYPFGSGDPNRQKDQTAVLRLIPGADENSIHGGHLTNWVQGVEYQWRMQELARTGVDPGDQGGSGIKYCVDFRPSFTQYLPEQQINDNRCAQLYGVEFILAGYKNTGSGINARREWDPWFDVTNAMPQPRLHDFIHHYERRTSTGRTVLIKKTKDHQAGDTPVRWRVPKTWCMNPSPGNREWKPQEGRFRLDNAVELGRDDSVFENGACTDPPDLTGQTKMRRNETWEDFSPAHARDIVKRANTRAFVDADAYTFMGCAASGVKDPDPCSGNDDCSGDTEDDGVPPDGDVTKLPSLPASFPVDQGGPFPTQNADRAAGENDPTSCFPDENYGFQKSDLDAALDGLSILVDQQHLPVGASSPLTYTAGRCTVSYGWAVQQKDCYAKQYIDGTGYSVSGTLRSIANRCQYFSGDGSHLRGGGVVHSTVGGCIEYKVYSHGDPGDNF